MPFLDIAKAALQRGFSILPLNPKGKDPIKGWGPVGRVRTIDAVSTLPADCNVGIVADENYLILETDDEAQLRQLVRNLTRQEMPLTLTSQARFGRPHFFYRQTARTLEVGNCAVQGLFELRAKNQYVVGPGSVHPTGAVYQITADYEVLPMPGWLMDALVYLKGAEQSVPAGQKFDPVSVGQKLGEGEGRHYLLTSWAGRLWDGKKSFEELYQEIWAINEQSCDPPRTEAHVKDIVAWVMQNGAPHDPGPKVVFGSTEEWGHTSQELSKRELPARRVLLLQGGAPVLYEASLNQVFATRGIGKTNFALGLAGAMANGREFLKYKAETAENVMYVDGELPLVQLQERIAAQVGALPNFWYVNGEDLPNCRIPCLFHKNGPGQERLLAAVEKHSIKVLILDSLSSLFRFETNEERAWIEVDEFFMQLRQQYKLCVVTLHHAGKAGLQRGHSRGDDLLDVSIKLDKFPEWQAGQELAFQLSYEKVRHGGFLEPFDAVMANGKWEVNPETESITEAKQMIAAGKGRPAVVKKTGLSEHRIRRLMAQLQMEHGAELNSKHSKQVNQHTQTKKEKDKPCQL